MRELRLCPHCDQSVTRVRRTWRDKLLLRTSVYWCKTCKRRVLPTPTAVKQRQRWHKREGMILGALILVGIVGWFLWLLGRPPAIRKAPARRRAAAPAASGRR